MNMISELRRRVRQNGKAEITPEEFDRLQAEWITRTGAEDMVIAEREACANACEDFKVPDQILGAHPDYLEGKMMAFAQAAAAIRARPNAEITGG